MYSYEDRVQAVRLYLKLGKRIKATIRQLGYPTKNSLKAWHREYEQCHDLRTGYVRATPRYSAQQKQAAVDHYLSHYCCVAATLRALGYPSRGRLQPGSKNCAPKSEIPCRQSSWQRSEIASGETGGGHRIVRQRRTRTRGCPENRREQADAVQLEDELVS